ncbi:MAG: HAD family hydrolase [Betaproteobacteria bacterium RBG_16_64_18]|nr:MAG: HAD family hydrolase [Betaproteobacteria bacterium RBG_16_64_18]OGA10773.1 MAG: HAD family hydrolase [Betaproteobacteria bacterium RIFCSPLOWO2_02_FULL_65_20]OGB60314.1 MAG: HAD family hydrolase [Burkholderiales bacterium RIFCSPLOWO2_12_FULL_64_99]
MQKRFELIVFDWDGTLMDSAGAIVACIQAACRDLDLPVPDDERAAHVIGLGLADALSYVIPGLPPSEYRNVSERYRHHFLLRDPHIPLFPGTQEMLAGLQARGHRLAIATGKSTKGLERALHTTAVAHFFVASRCADQCASKPAPDMLHELMQELAAEVGTTLMIGDTVHDLQMAANAGVAALAVGHGAHPREKLLALDPIACVDSTAELQRWLYENA